MTFYQELQLNQAGSKNLLKKSETLKEKLYHMWVYLVKIAATMAFCFFFVSIFSILFGNENSIVGVVVLLCLMVFRNADLGIHTGQSTMLLALFFVIMTVCPHLANQFSPVLGMLLNIAALAVLILFGCHNPFMAMAIFSSGVSFTFCSHSAAQAMLPSVVIITCPAQRTNRKMRLLFWLSVANFAACRRNRVSTNVEVAF